MPEYLSIAIGSAGMITAIGLGIYLAIAKHRRNK